MENTCTEILFQRGRKYLYVTAILFRYGLLVEIGVILYIFYSGTKIGSPTVNIQFALYAGTEFFLHVVIIPNVQVGVIMAHIERRQCVFHEASYYQVYRIFPKTEIQIHISIYAELSHCFVHNTNFTVYRIV